MEEIAYAKINLALHVRAREPDGYHRIETLFAFAEDGDCLSVAPSDELELDLVGPFAAALGSTGDNLVMRAALALRERFGVRKGAALRLDKRLPVASGIGGGSADAAAALRLLSRFWDLSDEAGALQEIARTLGADVPACLGSQTAWGEGRGDLVEPAEGMTGTPLLLVNPAVAVSTAQVFGGWDGQDRGPLPRTSLGEAAAAGRNDLEAPASAIAPVIGDVLEALRGAAGTTLVRMSGSGATCFALFDSLAARDRAAATFAMSHPHWWRLATRLR